MRRSVIAAVLVLAMSAGTQAAFAAVVAPAPAAKAQAPAPGAKAGQLKVMAAYIGDLQGKAKVLVDGIEPWIDAKNAIRLTPGTQIKTEAGSSLTVVFTDGSKIKLGPNATFKLEEVSMSKVAVYVGLGKLDAWVNKLKSRLFQARNPVAVASVRGTIFTMNVISPTQVMMSCFQGGLSVADNFGRTQSVEAGQQLAASSTAGAAEPPAALPPEAAAPPPEPVITAPEVLAAIVSVTQPGATEAAPAPAPTAEEVPAETTETTDTSMAAPEAAPASNPTQEAAVAPPPDSCTTTAATSESAASVVCP
ncbi:MAG: FecR domain-containing protein [Elusimicrobia bacterium]|nr:FecR domain-containing protein [Elusimicrobiota bacterium]